MLYKETLLLNIGKKGSHHMIVGGSWLIQGWMAEDALEGAELTPTTLPNGQELLSLHSMPNSPQTSVAYYGNKIDSITVTRLDTNKSITCPYYDQPSENHQNLKMGDALFTADDIGKKLWINITIP